MSSLISANKEQKAKDKQEKLLNSQLHLDSEGSDEEPSDLEDNADRLDTEDLTKILSKRRQEKEIAAAAVDETKKGYNWKFSVVKHRRGRQWWEIFIIVIALYSVLVIPIRIGINTALLDPYYNYIDLVTYLIYLADVVINVRTTYIDNYGHEVVDSKKIAIQYIASMRFIIDILSLFNLPNLLVQGGSMQTLIILNILGLLKISRYFRAQSLIV